MIGHWSWCTSNIYIIAFVLKSKQWSFYIMQLQLVYHDNKSEPHLREPVSLNCAYWNLCVRNLQSENTYSIFWLDLLELTSMHLNNMIIFVLFCFVFNHFLLIFHYGRGYITFCYHHFNVVPMHTHAYMCVHIHKHTHILSPHFPVIYTSYFGFVSYIRLEYATIINNPNIFMA